MMFRDVDDRILISLIDRNVDKKDSTTCGEVNCRGVKCKDCPLSNPHNTLGDVRLELAHRDKPADNPETIEGVTKPSHYALFDDVEAIEVIARSMTREQFKGYCLGNILKYRLRAGKKSELAYLEKDLAKADFYGELYEQHKDKCYA